MTERAPPALELQFAARLKHAAADAKVTWSCEELSFADPGAVEHAALVEGEGDSGEALDGLVADVVARAAAAPRRTLVGMATLRKLDATRPGSYYLLAQWRYH